MNARETFIYTVTGPSGSGKSTLVKRLAEDPLFSPMENWTTRPPRWPDDTDYRFCSEDTYLRMREAGEFISIRETREGKYGLRRPFPGRANLTIVDPGWVRMIRDLYPEMTDSVVEVVNFLLEAPRSVCEERIRKMGGNSVETRLARLETEFWDDGAYRTDPIDRTSFIRLNGASLSAEDLLRTTSLLIKEVLLPR